MLKFFQKLLAGLVGYLASVRHPAFLVRYAIRKYSKIYKLELDDFLLDNNIKSFDDFFTRSLKEGARPLQDGFVSPVDARVYASGKAQNDIILQVKGQEMAIQNLIADKIEGDLAYVSMYLSPADYHRYHAPVDLEIKKIRHIPGMYYSVRPEIAEKRCIYLKNERVILECKTSQGRLWLVFIAALNVGKIGLTALDGKAPRSKKISDIPFFGKSHYKKGDELGMFHMGSSVVIIAENQNFTCNPGDKLAMGQSISA